MVRQVEITQLDLSTGKTPKSSRLCSRRSPPLPFRK